MSLRINTNITALNAHRQLEATDQRMGVSLERLSSGYRINKAKDDVAADKFQQRDYSQQQDWRQQDKWVDHRTLLLRSMARVLRPLRCCSVSC